MLPYRCTWQGRKFPEYQISSFGCNLLIHFSQLHPPLPIIFLLSSFHSCKKGFPRSRVDDGPLRMSNRYCFSLPYSRISLPPTVRLQNLSSLSSHVNSTTYSLTHEPHIPDLHPSPHLVILDISPHNPFSTRPNIN